MLACAPRDCVRIGLTAAISLRRTWATATEPPPEPKKPTVEEYVAQRRATELAADADTKRMDLADFLVPPRRPQPFGTAHQNFRRRGGVHCCCLAPG
jgi:hypothetical protein